MERQASGLTINQWCQQLNWLLEGLSIEQPKAVNVVLSMELCSITGSVVPIGTMEGVVCFSVSSYYRRENRYKMADAENKDILNLGSGKPQITDRLHWNISSNVLCNYMKEQKYLDLILQNQAIIPRYVIEPIEYLGLGNFKNICFPMTCFCDIPFSKVASHMSRYGEYGIGLDKEMVLNKYRIQPIQYINSKSPLADDFKQAFLSYFESDQEIDGLHKVLSDYLISALVYMKPVWRQETDSNGDLKNYIYQDECEWRYIPSDRFPKDLKFILPQEMTNNHAKEIFSKVLRNHKECWLQFEWEDVRYIMVPDEAAVRKTIYIINSLPILDEEKHELMTKIEISSRFADDL